MNKAVNVDISSADWTKETPCPITELIFNFHWQNDFAVTHHIVACRAAVSNL